MIVGLQKAEPVLLCNKRILCDWVKYIAALLVVNGHLFIFSNPQSPLSPFMNLGACCVSIFFFFSGYGLMTSYEQKGNKYITDFFRRRLTRVLLPLLTAYIVTLPIYALLKGPVDWKTVLVTLSWGGPYLKFSWYVTEIVALYLIYYPVMRLRANIGVKRIVLTAFVLILMASLIVAHQPIWYIISLPGFVIGIWFQAYENKLSCLISQDYMLLFFTVIWFFTWQWHLIGQDFLPAYRWEYLSYYIYNVAFVGMIAGFICKSGITPP